MQFLGLRVEIRFGLPKFIERLFGLLAIMGGHLGQVKHKDVQTLMYLRVGIFLKSDIQVFKCIQLD